MQYTEWHWSSPWICKSIISFKYPCHIHMSYSVHENSWGQGEHCLEIRHALVNLIVVRHTTDYMVPVRWIYHLCHLILVKLTFIWNKWLKGFLHAHHRLKMLPVLIMAKLMLHIDLKRKLVANWIPRNQDNLTYVTKIQPSEWP